MSPIVPMRSPVPGVASEALPGVRLNPNVPREAFGGVQPPDVAPIQGIIGQMYQQEKAKANQIAVNDADNQATALRDRVLYGPPDDPSQGILNKRGKDAFAAPEQALDQWKQGLSDITNGLNNDEQKLAFYNRVDGYDHALHLEIQSHIAKERQQYDVQTTSDYVALRGADAARSFANPAAVDTNIALGNAALADLAKRSGASPDTIRLETQRNTSAIRLDVIKSMLHASDADGGGDLRASAYFAQHFNDFTARDLEQAQALTDKSSILGESQRTAAGILKTATSLSDAIKQAERVSDPQIQEGTKRELRQHFADLAASDRDARNAAFTRSSNAVQQGTPVDRLPIEDRVLLSPDEYLQLDHVAQRIKNPVVETAPTYYTDWSNAAALAPQDFLSHDFGKDRVAGKVSEQDFHYFTRMQFELRTREARAESSAATRALNAQKAVVFKAYDAADKLQRSHDASENSPTFSKLSEKDKALIRSHYTPPHVPSIPPAWLDSAAVSSDWLDLLRLHHIPVDSLIAQRSRPNAPAQPPAPKAPGAPITLTPQQ